MLLGGFAFAVAGCSAADITVDGHEFHLSSARLMEFTTVPGGEKFYRFDILNVSNPCALNGEPEGPQPLDELWFHLQTTLLSLESAPSASGGAAICIGEEAGCDAPGARSFWTSDDGVVHIDPPRVRMYFDFTNGDSGQLDEPFRVDLDLPYEICE